MISAIHWIYLFAIRLGLATRNRIKAEKCFFEDLVWRLWETRSDKQSLGIRSGAKIGLPSSTFPGIKAPKKVENGSQKGRRTQLRLSGEIKLPGGLKHAPPPTVLPPTGRLVHSARPRDHGWTSPDKKPQVCVSPTALKYQGIDSSLREGSLQVRLQDEFVPYFGK